MKIYALFLLTLAITSHSIYGADVSASDFTYKINTYSKSSFNIFVYQAASNPDVSIGNITCGLNKNKTSAEIIALDIDDSYRYKGLGTQLMLRAFKYMKANNIKKIRWISLYEAMPFYARFGAQRIKKPHANFEYVFERDGDPKQNLKKYYKTKGISGE